MPTIKEQIAANQARISAGGETGTGVGPTQTALTAAPTPPSDLPAGGGLPQRGMFPANLVLSSDRSDSNRAFREAGVRSSTFPYAPPSTSIATTIVQQAQASSSSSGSASNLTAGPGIIITGSSGKGFTVSGIVGSLSMPSIFAVSGASPITNVNTAPILVTLVPELANTFFAGPVGNASSGLGTFDVEQDNENPVASASSTLPTLTPSSSGNEWAVLAMSAITGVSGTPSFTAPAGWLQLQPTPGSNGQGLSWFINTSAPVTPSVGFSPNASYASVGALFFAPNGPPAVIQNGFAGPIANVTSTFTFGSPTVAGNSILIFVEYIEAHGALSVTNLHDSQGNTFHLLGNSQGGSSEFSFVSMYYAENIVGGADTVSITTTSPAGNGVMWVAEVSGLTVNEAVPTFRHIFNVDLRFAVFGASGVNHQVGAVPDPGSVAGTTRFLNEQAIWTTAVSILKTNGTLNGSQTTLNLAAGTDISVTDNGSGTVTIANLAPSGGVNKQTSNYTAVAGDSGLVIDCNSGSAFTVKLPSSPPSSIWWVIIHNRGTGAVTVNPNGLTIDGSSSSMTLFQGDALIVNTDGTNYFTGMARPVSIGIFQSGVSTNGAVLLYLTIDRPCTFPASAPNSFANAKIAATGSTTYTFKKNGSSFATVLFSASGTTGAYTQASAASFAAGDILELDAPVTADATLANIGFTLQGYRF